MSAAGFTPIQLYRTTTASAVPSAGNLADGELAINLTDEALYFKNAAGVVTLLADSSGALGSVTSVNASGGTTGMTFSGGPITSSGTLTLGGTLNVANGGTGATTLSSGYLLRGNGTSAVNSSIIFDNGTNVGVGTTSPGAKLDVAGNVAITNGVLTMSDAYPIRWGGAASGIYSGSGSSDMVFTVGSAERFRVNGATGNVGIGTSSPLTRLNLEGGSFLLRGGTIDIGPTAGANGAARISSSLANVVEGTLIFSTQNSVAAMTEAMRITSAGDVGIGTASPSARLHVTAGSSPNASQLLVNFAGTSANYYDANTQIFRTGSFAETMRITPAGDVGIGTSSPGTKLHAVGGNVWSSNFFEVGRFQRASGTGVSLGYDNSAYVATIGAYSHDGTASNLSFWTYPGSGSALERMRIDSAGNLGLGVTPSAWWASIRALDLGANASLFSFASGANVQTGVTNNAFINSSVQYVYKTSAAASNYLQNSGSHIWYTAPSGTAGNAISFTQAMTLDASGNLGIGTTSPGMPLDVQSNASALGIRIRGRAADNFGFFQFSSNNLASSAFIGSNGSLLQFEIGGSERMRIDSSGNVGIGVTNPNARLSVSRGSAGVIANITDGVAQSLQVSSGSGYIGFLNPNFGAITFRNGSDNAEFMRIDSSGNVGIGTSSPGARLSVANGNINLTDLYALNWGVQSTYIYGSSAAGNIKFATNAADRMTIDSSGNVGIGTTAPAVQLQINGTQPQIQWSNPTTGATSNDGTHLYLSGSDFWLVNKETAAMVFATNNTERARIDSSGNLLVGTTTQLASTRQTVVSGSNGVAVQVANGAVGSYMTNTSGTGDWQPFSFNVNGTSFTQVGSITITGGTTTNYNTSSDYRLKEIDGPIQNSGAYIDALKPVQGSWKADGSRFIGLLAHEVQEVSETQIATGEKDGEQMQAMDYSAPEIIANLIAEIQSLRARVAQLEGN